jgi:hypothetical protein
MIINTKKHKEKTNPNGRRQQIGRINGGFEVCSWSVSRLLEGGRGTTPLTLM